MTTTRCSHRLLPFITTALVCTVAVPAAKPDDVVGNWRTKGGESVIRIERTGTVYGGRVLWLKEPTQKDGKPKIDDKNPDAARRGRPILGLDLLRGFRFDGKDTWIDGKIYDPRNGKDYSCTMRIDEHGDLAVRGFVGISLIGRTETWQRAEKPAE